MTSERIQNRLAAVQRWVESRDYQGYEPSDGNLSPFHALTFEIPVLERALQQLIWKSPLDLRRLFGVPMHRSTKGTGYMASGYTCLFRLTGEAEYRARAEACLDWLMRNRSSGPHDCWGDHFPFSSRGGRRPAHEPTLVWSSLIGQAFLDAWEAFPRDEYLQVAESVSRWIRALPRNPLAPGLCLGYTSLGKSTIHNSNMLGAAFLAREGALRGDKEALDLAAQAMEFSASRLRPEGWWPYAEAPRHEWIDSFHTGYNLDSLRGYMEASGDRRYEESLRRGFAFFKARFFEADGRPKYYHDCTYPIDIQCAAQAIETLVLFSDLDDEALPMAGRVADWTLDHMQDPDGHFYYRDLGWRNVKTPMFHWGQATMFKALACLLTALRPSDGAAGRVP